MSILDPKPPTRAELTATYLTVLVHNGTAYPARPASAPAGMVRYVGPTSPTGALSGDEWLDTSGATADTTAPSAVSGLTAGTATTTTVPLSWTAATDNVAVAGYEYSTNGTTYTSTGSTGTSYTVTGLTAGTAYTLYVRAFDAAGNRGAAASVSKTTAASADTTAPSAVTGLTAGTPTSSTIPLTWTAATDNVAVTGYEYSTNGTTWVSTGSTATSYTVTGLTASTAYTVQVRAFDAAGNKGAAASVSATTTSAAAAWSTLATDDFTGADGSISGRTTTTGAMTWTSPVASNTYAQAGTGVAKITGNLIKSITGDISQTAQLTVSNQNVRVSGDFDLTNGASTSRQVRLFARAQSTPTSSSLIIGLNQAGTLSAYTQTGAAITLTGTTTGFAKTGNLALEVTGTDFKVLVNGTQVATGTTTATGTFVGFAAYENEARLDNFKVEVYA